MQTDNAGDPSYTYTYNAYYTNPDVQQARGHGGPPQPNGFQLESLDEARLEGVKRRGKRWRDA